MSDATITDRLTIDEQISRIERQQAETRKFAAEMNKLTAETLKLGAEARKFDRDRFLAPWLAIIGLIGGLIAIASALARLKGWGG
jgi:hypothetical protein